MGVFAFLFIPVVFACDTKEHDTPIVFITYGNAKILLKTVDQLLGDDRNYTYDEIEPMVDHMSNEMFINACISPIRREIGELKHSMYCDAIEELDDIFARWTTESVKRFNIIFLTHVLAMVSTRSICDPLILETIGIGFNLLVALCGIADGNPVKGLSFDEVIGSLKELVGFVMEKG